MSWWGVAAAWSGWAVAVATALAVRRRLAVVADAEHELRGAATAIGLAAEGGLGPLVQLELDRMTAALADLAEARGARPASAADLEAGRLAQVLANVIANAAEHGVGPVEVSARRHGGVVRLELSNRDRLGASARRAGNGRGRGVGIAKRAARELGGRLTVERAGGGTMAVFEVPGAAPPEESQGAAPPEEAPGAAPREESPEAARPGESPGAPPPDRRRAA